MNGEQVWEDLSRFAQAMKRGATVVMGDKSHITNKKVGAACWDANAIADSGGIHEIIEPPQKKIRPLNAEEWRYVAWCVICPQPSPGNHCWVSGVYNENDAAAAAEAKQTCHPPGFPDDVRKLYVEGDA